MIDKLVRVIRPSLLFNNKGAILADLGGLEYVDSIKLGYAKDVPQLPTRIEVKCKKFLALSPLLTSIDNYSFVETAERGEGLAWVFNLEPTSYTSDVDKFRFRLEILR